VLALPGPLAGLRDQAFDAYQRLMPRTRESAPALIVAIDEASLDAHGQWPWPRTLTARLVESIARAEPAAIGFDLLFPEPDRSAPEGDRAFAEALKRVPSVLAIAGLPQPDRRFRDPPGAPPVRLAGERELPLARYPGHLQSIEMLDRAAGGRGLISAQDARDAVVRQAPLVARVGELIVPSLSVEMVRVAAGLPFLAIDDRGGEDVDLVLADDLRIPMQSDGRLHVHFGGSDPDRFVSASEVLAGKVEAERVRGKLVLVGVTGLGLLDYKTTPLGELIPGVEVHAQVLEQIFDGRFLRRPTGAAAIEAAALLVAGAALVAIVPAATAWISAALLGALLLLFGAGGILAFRSGLLLDAATPSIGLLLVFGTLLGFTFAQADRQRRRLREAQARLAGELEAARRIQVGLLPDPRALFAGERRFSLEASLAPARTVGGDFYDCFLVDEHRLFFVVADVSGKGLPASLFMALSKSLLKSIALRAREPEPGEILTAANAEIGRDNPESLFVTAFAALLDLRTGVLAFSSAGHEPALGRRTDGTLEVLDHAGGPPLCVIEGFEYPTARRQLAPGELVCLVTDGVTEAMNPRGELYGAARMRELLARASDGAPEALVRALVEDIAAFAAGAEPADDVTLLSVRWNG